MTISEFKAWFAGFCEGIEAAPTAEQFSKIKAKVEALQEPAPKYTGVRAADRGPTWIGDPMATGRLVLEADTDPMGR